MGPRVREDDRSGVADLAVQTAQSYASGRSLCYAPNTNPRTFEGAERCEAPRISFSRPEITGTRIASQRSTARFALAQFAPAQNTSAI